MLPLNEKGQRVPTTGKMWGALALSMALLPALPAHACSKTVRWFDDAPYSFRAPNGHVAGFDVELTREVLRRIGCQAVFVEMPWARALVQL